MKKDKVIKINENALCILKFKPKSKLVMVTYRPITKTLQKDFQILEKRFELPNKNAKSLVKYIKTHNKLKVLFSTYNYCSSLDRPYQGFYSTIEEIEKRYPSTFDSLEGYEKENRKREEKLNLLSECRERLLAYFLEETYKKCRDVKKILAYSHKKHGFQTPQYYLNKDFSVEFKTNFGYGSVSYFYVRIRYKGLDIIPFSHWIKYEFAKKYEIIRYSEQFSLQNESWLKAMEYSCKACNLSITKEKAFVKKYIVDECKKMVVGLQNILKNDTFEFLNWERIYTDVHKAGHNLIEFRGEKISGALEFIEKILQFEKVAEIKKYIKIIEKCNKSVQPMLIKELILIKKELKQVSSNLRRLKPKYENLEKQNTGYNNKREKLKQRLLKSGVLTLSDFDNQLFEDKFSNKNPKYPEFIKEFEEISNKYFELNLQILSLKTTQENIEMYNNSIVTYFKPLT